MFYHLCGYSTWNLRSGKWHGRRRGDIHVYFLRAVRNTQICRKSPVVKHAREVISSRLSCRAFDGQPLSSSDEAWVSDVLKQVNDPPFGSQLGIALVPADDTMIADISERAPYGEVHNPAQFIVGYVQKGRHSMEDFGFVMEQAVLHVEANTISTCWLGGTFNRGGFASALGLDADVLIPAVVPIGYPARRRTVSDGSIRFSVGARKRKRWSELFYEVEFWDEDEKPQSQPFPLSPASAADYEAMLEAVRLAPSTSNQQPWRIYRYSADSGPDLLHLFVSRTTGFDKAIKDVDMQRIDAGVAMAHFSVVADEIGFRGRWTELKPAWMPRGVDYVATWVED